jgi:hypothetical protein
VIPRPQSSFGGLQWNGFGTLHEKKAGKLERRNSDDENRQICSTTYFDGVNGIAANIADLTSSRDQGQVVAVQKANKAENAVGLDDGFETATAGIGPIPTRVHPRTIGPRHSIARVEHFEHTLDFGLCVQVRIFHQKVSQGRPFSFNERTIHFEDSVFGVLFVTPDQIIALLRAG